MRERKFVVVGTAPPLEDVLSRAFLEPPFDLDSFSAYATKTFFAENLAFLEEINALRAQRDMEKYRVDRLHIMSEYVGGNSPSEVHLSDKELRETEARVATVLSGLDKDGLTMKAFFSFPSPVNNAESRLHACLSTLYVPVASYFAWHGVPWLWVPITYGYIARITCGPRLDPQALFVLFVLRPFVVDRLGLLENRFTPGPPKRFVQSIGLVFAALSMVLAFLKQYLAMGVVAAGLFGARFLSGFCNFCIACIIFGMAARSKILPTTVCEECNIQFMVGSQEERSAYRTKSRKSRANVEEATST